jgi:hypothetical protein
MLTYGEIAAYEAPMRATPLRRPCRRQRDHPQRAGRLITLRAGGAISHLDGDGPDLLSRETRSSTKGKRYGSRRKLSRPKFATASYHRLRLLDWPSGVQPISGEYAARCF